MKRFSKNSDLSPLPGLQWFKFFLAGFLTVAVLGCSPERPPPKTPLSETQKQFEKKCRDDYDMHVSTRMAGNTLWIYLPTQEPIFDYEAQKANSAEADRKPSKFAVQYVDGKFRSSRFVFEYDIVPRTKVKQEDYGYNSSYTDSYVKQQNNLFTAINDVFFNVKIEEVEPQFIVFVITDIKKGIESRLTMYLQDFKRYMSGDLPPEEYQKRYLGDTKGGQSLIGDETGSHVQYTDVKMPEFLAKQIVNRINFKFLHSDFPPPDKFDNTIVGIIADTLRYYKFEDYATVHVHNLRENNGIHEEKKLIFEKNQLANFTEEEVDRPGKGRLIKIRFDKGNVKVSPSDEESSN